MTPSLVLFDLDSTLCDTSHRHHMILEGERRRFTDWHGYSMACMDDVPVEGVFALARMFHASGYDIGILSARDHDALALTVSWLDFYRFPPRKLIILRNYAEDSSKNEIFKARQAMKLRAKGAKIALMVDDWPPVAQTFAQIGIPCLLVQPPYEKLSLEQIDEGEQDFLHSQEAAQRRADTGERSALR